MSNNLKITITGGRMAGKTGLAVVIARALREAGINPVLHESALDPGESIDPDANGKRLDAIALRGGRIEIHAKTSPTNIDPLA